MKKILLSTFLMLVTAAFVQAQVIINENFDSYSNGDKIAQTAGAPWTTWSASPGGAEDGTVTSYVAKSGSNSLKIVKDNDCVLQLGDSTTGHYIYSMNLYTPQDTISYFNVLHVFAGQSSSWAIDNYGIGYDSTFHLVLQGHDTATAYFKAGSWNAYKLDVDMDKDEAKLFINDTLLFTWPWTMTAGDTSLGPNQLGGVDFYGYDVLNNGNCILYIDDIKLEKLTSTSINNATNEAELNIYPNPASSMLNIESSRDFKSIRIYDIAGAEVMYVPVNHNMQQIDISNLANGVYYVSINYENSIVVRKLVKR